VRRAAAACLRLKSGIDPGYGTPMNTSVDTPQTRAARWLGRAGLRPTRQRLALAELLIGDGLNRHVTAETLFEAARARDAAVSLATVYNTLHAFRDAGLLREVIVEGTKSWFDTRTDDHPHFYWEESGTVTDAPKEGLRIAAMPDPPDGAEIVSVDVVIRLRRACLARRQNH
jgi:Fur family transcriptional regulator, iron response regulator